MSLNYFCEKHGKNSRDQHFSTVSNFIEQESLVKKLCSSQDICDAIVKGQLHANLNNARISSLQRTNTSREFLQTDTKAYVVPVNNNSNVIHRLLVVDNLKRYYNFYTDDDSYVLKSHFMSDQSEFEIIQTTEKNTIDKITTNKKVDKIAPVVFSSSYLSQKMMKWRVMQREKKPFIAESQISSDNRFNDNRQRNLSYNHCKAACSHCKKNCEFRLSELNSENLTQVQVTKELHEHGHPKSRKDRATRTNRTLAQAKIELYNHYRNFHFLNLE